MKTLYPIGWMPAGAAVEYYEPAARVYGQNYAEGVQRTTAVRATHFAFIGEPTTNDTAHLEACKRQAN